MGTSKERTATDILDDLTNVVWDAEAVPSSEQAHSILADDEVDREKIREWSLEKLAGVRARQELKAARTQRIGLTKHFEKLKKSLVSRGSATRDSIIEKLTELGQVNPEAAQVFCRKLEEVSEEDWQDLEAELMTLDSDAFKD